MSPIMVVANWLTPRRQGNRSHRSQMAEHRARVAAIEADIAETIVLERHDRRVATPDPAELLIVATGPRARLWERRRTDPDHLVVRIGIADLPSMITVEAADLDRRTEPRYLTDVPVALHALEQVLCRAN
jgi:S-DNA-T family DNA segregation ATPase FtsK/SpoIIIE